MQDSSPASQRTPTSSPRRGSHRPHGQPQPLRRLCNASLHQTPATPCRASLLKAPVTPGRAGLSKAEDLDSPATPRGSRLSENPSLEEADRRGAFRDSSHSETLEAKAGAETATASCKPTTRQGSESRTTSSSKSCPRPRLSSADGAVGIDQKQISSVPAGPVVSNVQAGSLAAYDAAIGSLNADIALLQNVPCPVSTPRCHQSLDTAVGKEYHSPSYLSLIHI